MQIYVKKANLPLLKLQPPPRSLKVHKINPGHLGAKQYTTILRQILISSYFLKESYLKILAPVLCNIH